MNPIDEITSDLNRVLRVIQSGVDDDIDRAKHDFASDMIEAFIKYAKRIDELDRYDGPDLLNPVATMAATICSYAIFHHHPLGACDTCSEALTDRFRAVLQISQSKQDDPDAPRH